MGVSEQIERAIRHRQVVGGRIVGLGIAADRVAASRGARIERHRRRIGADEPDILQRIGIGAHSGGATAALDQAAVGRLRQSGIIRVDVARLGIARGVIGVEHQVAVGVPAPVVREDRVRAVHVVRRNDDAAPVVREAGTGRELKPIAAMIEQVGITRLGAAADAVEILVEHQVDDTGDGVRAPGGRGAAGHDVDALHQDGRHGAEVDDAVDVRGDDALAVEQDKRAVAAELTKVDGVEAGDAADDVVVVGAVVGRRGRADRGQFANAVADADLGIALKLRFADHRNRRRLAIAGGRDTRTGDHDVTRAYDRTIGRIVHLRACRAGNASGQGQSECGNSNKAIMTGHKTSHLPSQISLR